MKSLVFFSALLIALLPLFSIQGSAQKIKPFGPPNHTSAHKLHPLVTLKPGHWIALGKNTLYDVRYTPEPGGKPIESIITAWSGAAYNTDLNQLWVHGGGHAATPDNGIYAFDVDTLEWSRLFDPSTQVTGHTGRYYLDGKPASVHSYDYIEYIPYLKRMVVAGARGPYPGVAPYTTVDAVDKHGHWVRLNHTPSCEHPTAAYHPETGILWQHGGESSGFLSSFEPVFGMWRSHGQWNTDQVPGPYRTSAIDPVNKKFVALNVGYWSDNSVWVWDISGGHGAGVIKGQKLNMTGDTEILFVNSKGSPGLDWHPGVKKLYAWFGGIHVYEVDVNSEKITKVPVNPKNSVIPAPGNYNGVYGRWRYVSKYNVFMGVLSVYGPVYFFKLP